MRACVRACLWLCVFVRGRTRKCVLAGRAYARARVCDCACVCESACAPYAHTYWLATCGPRVGEDRIRLHQCSNGGRRCSGVAPNHVHDVARHCGSGLVPRRRHRVPCEPSAQGARYDKLLKSGTWVWHHCHKPRVPAVSPQPESSATNPDRGACVCVRETGIWRGVAARGERFEGAYGSATHP